MKALVVNDNNVMHVKWIHELLINGGSFGGNALFFAVSFLNEPATPINSINNKLH